MKKRAKVLKVRKDFLGRLYVSERVGVLGRKEKRIYLEKSERLVVGRIIRK